MKRHSRTRWLATLAAIAALGIAACAGLAPADGERAVARADLAAVVAGNHRPADHRARDQYRHPVETLTFFGLRPDMTVVELWPFGGWYTEILAPYVRDRGVYYAAAMDPASTSEEDVRNNAELRALLDSRPDLYSKVRWSVLAGGQMNIAPEGTADMVLTFRNIHNWAWTGIERDVLAAAYRALKPGGILGVVEHRSNDPDFDPKTPGQAWVGEDYAVRLVESAGFRLVARSDINRNPLDTKDYPRGVWTLPPTYAMGDQDRDRYAAIGESDRFTLKFEKPE
jgi:predicted methyltransferase